MLSILSKPPVDLPEYYRRLFKHDDLYLHVGGMCALLDLSALPRDEWETAVALSEHGAVAIRAFHFFMEAYEYDLASRVIGASEKANRPRPSDRMHASFRLDAH